MIGELKRRGWVVVEHVLDPEEVTDAINDFWTWAETILGRSRYDKTLARTRLWFVSLHGIIKNYAVGQSPMMWKLRLNSRVQDLFRVVWGVDDDTRMITSFDGCSVVRPPEGTRRATFRPSAKPWFHVDQTPATSANAKLASTSFGAKAIQGAVNLFDSDADDACFYVLDGSHLLHARFFREHAHERPSGDFFMLSNEHIQWYEAQGCERVAVAVTAGSVTLWDSRLVHCSKLPSPGRAHPERWRLTAFICMMPRKLCTAKTLARRCKIALDNRTTCHWPNQPRVNARKPRETHMGELGYIELPPHLTAECMELV